MGESKASIARGVGFSASTLSREVGRGRLISRVGDSESKAFWTEFLRGLRERGLAGVQLVISHHRGLIAAIDQVMTGATWQRCRVHFMRNVLTRVPKASSATPPRSARSSPSPPDPGSTSNP